MPALRVFAARHRRQAAREPARRRAGRALHEEQMNYNENHIVLHNIPIHHITDQLFIHHYYKNLDYSET